MGAGGEDEKMATKPEDEEKKAAKGKKEEKKDEDMSEEDLKLKEDLELMVERLQDKDVAIAKNALVSMRDAIRSATASMTSVPKPLKFLRPHYETITAFYDTVTDQDLKVKDYYCSLRRVMPDIWGLRFRNNWQMCSLSWQ